MEIYQIAAELAPIAKVGGLGDVIYGLSRELVKQGYSTTLLLPRYGCIAFEDLEKTELVLTLSIALPCGSLCETLFWKGSYHNLSIILIEPRFPFNYFDSPKIYGEHHDTQRFLLFSYLCLSYITHLGKSPICLHLHDWQTAFVSVFLKLHFSKKIPHVKTVLTIHNLMHQGKALFSDLALFNIPHQDCFADPQHPSCINLLKSGMLAADSITTVSPTYAEEICHPSYSYYLDKTLWETKEKTQGILNGIDYEYWNPNKKHLLPHPYSAASSGSELLAAKQKNKEFLQKQFKLEICNKPLFCCISRLDHQKGPYLLAHAAKHILQNGGQYFILGTPSTFEMRDLFTHLQTTLPSQSFVFYDGFNEGLSHLVYASSNAILIPSIFEPCGLTQLIAMHYGTVPIARKTGGLADTVIDLNDTTAPNSEKTGFVFEKAQEDQLMKKIDDFFALYHDKPSLSALISRITKKNYSWEIPVKHYLKLYLD